MTIAYADTYLSCAQRNLGSMLDFAVNACGLELKGFYEAFLALSLSERFSKGDPAIIAGRSGEELALEVVNSSCLSAEVTPSLKAWTPPASATREYWTGWALAFYQWASGCSFIFIQERVSIEQVASLYHPYHEMDIRHFCEKMDELARAAHPQSNLQTKRLAAGLSQRALAEASGVPLRTLQQYEQRQKNISHARVDYVVSLARVLACQPSDLLEYSSTEAFEYAFVSL